jgi:hypothetical protein
MPILSAIFAYRRRSSGVDYTDISPESWIIIGIIVVTAILAIIGITIVNNMVTRRRLLKASQSAIRNYQLWRKDIAQNGGNIPPIKTDLLLDKDEQVFAYSVATLIEPRSVRHSTHTGVGTVIKGIAIGQGYSTSSASDEWKVIAGGVLYATNKRLIFDGDTNDRSIKIKDIISVQAAALSIDISTSRRQKSMVFQTCHAMIFRDVIKATRESIES